MISAARFLKAMCVLASIFVLGAIFAHASGPVLSFQGLAQKLGNVSSASGIAVDPSGNVYVLDSSANALVKFSPQGVQTTLSITGLSPGLNSPIGLAIDNSGNLYISDTGNTRIVMVTPSLVGSVVPLGSLTLVGPEGVAVDKSGNLFIADTGNNRIVEVTSGGTAAALTLTGATLNSPSGLATDLTGNLYIADTNNHRIVKVAAGTTTATVVTTSGVSVSLPTSIATDSTGNLFFGDILANHVVGVDTSSNAQVLVTPSTTLSSPNAVAVDVFGSVYIGDSGDGAVYKVSPSLTPSLTSGNYYSLNRTAVGFGHTNVTTGSTVTLSLPFLIGSTAVTSVQAFTNGIASSDFTGSTNTCASITLDTCSISVSFKANSPGVRNGALVLYNGTTPLITVPLFGVGDAPVAVVGGTNVASVISTGALTPTFPFQVALDGNGNMYVSSDTPPNNLLKIPAGGGTATAIATPGFTIAGESDGIAVDGSGNVFIADHTGNRILVVTPAGLASVLTINGTVTPALSQPTGLALDGAGNLYIGNYGNGSVIEVSNIVVNGSTSSGLGRTIATPGFTFPSSQVTGVAVSPSGTVYIAARTANSSKVVQVTASGVASAVTTTGFTTSNPQGVFVDGMGNLYIVDAGNNRLLRVTASGITSAFSFSGVTPAPNLTGYGITTDVFGNLYIPDANNNRILSIPTGSGNLSFANTNVGSTSTDSPKAVTIANLGNQPLVVAATTGYTTNFINNTSDANLCTAVPSVAPGQTCDISVSFTPQSASALSANILASDNHLNVLGSQQRVVVSGTGLQPADTTATAVAISPTSIVNGQTATITATVTDTQSGKTSTVPTGSVTFTDTVGSTIISLNGGTAVTLNGSGVATLSGVQLSGIGTHTIGANYGGVTNTFLTSNGSATAPVTLTPVTLTSPATQPLVVNYQQASLFTEFVSGPYTTIAVPSGSLSYSIINGGGTVFASGTKALTAGSTNSSADIPIVGTLSPGSYTVNLAYSGDANYQASTTVTTVAIRVNQVTPTLAWVPSPSSLTYGANLTGVLDATATFSSTAVPGAFSYTATPAGGSGAVVTNASVLGAATYSLAVFFTPTDTTTYTTIATTISYTVNKAPQTINFTAPTTPVNFGVSPITLVATGGASGNAVTFSVVSGPATVSGSTLTITGAGSVVVAANQATSTNYAAATQVTQTVVVTKAAPAIVLTSSVNPVLSNAAVTFTATVSSSLASPTGTVSFFNGTTLLGTGTMASGVATFATSALPLGANSITAVYSGDTNFVTVTSAALTETVVFDFTVVSSGGTSGSPATATVLPGGTGTYTLTITPVSGTAFPLATTLTITGLPAGATVTVAPTAWVAGATNTWTLPANTPITPLAISIKTAAITAMSEHQNPLDRKLPLLALGVLLLPFSRRMRRTARRAGRTVSLLLIVASLAAVTGLTGCGATNGFFGQGPQTYTVTETVTTGTISHSATVTLIVQ